MARKPMSHGTKRLTRTGFKPRVGAIARKLSAPILKPARKSAMKSKGPRMTPIRRAARGQDCTLMIPGVCNRDPDTTVLCHSNALADGKGMGLKAPDTAACFGCCACHDVLDGRAPRPGWMTKLVLDAVFERGVTITHGILRAAGLLP